MPYVIIDDERSIYSSYNKHASSEGSTARKQHALLPAGDESAETIQSVGRFPNVVESVHFLCKDLLG